MAYLKIYFEDSVRTLCYFKNKIMLFFPFPASFDPLTFKFGNFVATPNSFLV